MQQFIARKRILYMNYLQNSYFLKAFDYSDNSIECECQGVENETHCFIQ